MSDFKQFLHTFLVAIGVLFGIPSMLVSIWVLIPSSENMSEDRFNRCEQQQAISATNLECEKLVMCY
jgi:hypothetical protein